MVGKVSNGSRRRKIIFLTRFDLHVHNRLKRRSAPTTLSTTRERRIRKLVSEQLEESLRHEIGSYVERRLSEFKQEIAQLQNQLNESLKQILEREGRLPDSIFACVGGGSNAIGMFHAFVGDQGVRLAQNAGG